MENSLKLYDPVTVELVKSDVPPRTYSRTRFALPKESPSVFTSDNAAPYNSQAAVDDLNFVDSVESITVKLEPPDYHEMEEDATEESDHTDMLDSSTFDKHAEPTGAEQEQCEMAVLVKSEQSEMVLKEEEEDASSNDELMATAITSSAELTEGQTYFACPVCMNLFEEMKLAELHLKCHRDGSASFHCFKCISIYESWVLMEQHLKVHDAEATKTPVVIPRKPPKPIILKSRKAFDFSGQVALGCPYCLDDHFTELDDVKFHLECHRLDDDLIHCPYCEVVSQTWVLMQQHLCDHPEVPERLTLPSANRRCPICWKMVEHADDVVRHCDAFHTNDTSIECEICHSVWSDWKQFLEHHKEHDDIAFECSECQVQTRTMKAMSDHQKCHLGVGFVCSNCNLMLGAEYVDLHKATCKQGREMRNCGECKRQVGGLIAQRLHNQHFHEERLKHWPCAKCTYVGRSKTGLQLHHERIHDRPFNCSECRYACQTQQTLMKHILLFHSDSAPVQTVPPDTSLACSKCSYHARDRRLLTQHTQRAHRDGADAFPCVICDAAFRTQLQLNDHMPSHVNVREAFACGLCLFSAKFRPALYRHILNKHPGITLSNAILRTSEKKPVYRASRGRSKRSAPATINNGNGLPANVYQPQVEPAAGGEVAPATTDVPADEVTPLTEAVYIDASGTIVVADNQNEAPVAADENQMHSESEPSYIFCQDGVNMDEQPCEIFVISKGGRVSQILTKNME